MYAKLKILVLGYKHGVKSFPGLYCKALQLCDISLEVAPSLPTATRLYRRCLETGHTGKKAVRNRSAFISCNFNTVCKAANRVQCDSLPFAGARTGVKAAAHRGKEGMLTASGAASLPHTAYVMLLMQQPHNIHFSKLYKIRIRGIPNFAVHVQPCSQLFCIHGPAL